MSRWICQLSSYMGLRFHQCFEFRRSKESYRHTTPVSSRWANTWRKVSAILDACSKLQTAWHLGVCLVKAIFTSEWDEFWRHFSPSAEQLLFGIHVAEALQKWIAPGRRWTEVPSVICDSMMSMSLFWIIITKLLKVRIDYIDSNRYDWINNIHVRCDIFPTAHFAEHFAFFNATISSMKLDDVFVSKGHRHGCEGRCATRAGHAEGGIRKIVDTKLGTWECWNPRQRAQKAYKLKRTKKVQGQSPEISATHQHHQLGV